MDGIVIAVSRRKDHAVSKQNQIRIRLVAGQGVEDDAHFGELVQHRSRVARDPTQPNLRQVHLLHTELLHELRAAGFAVEPGQMGENITTRGIDLLALPARARLRLGDEAVVEVTGLRNPCTQLDQIQQGLMAATLDRNEQGELIRKAGIMCVVVRGGEVKGGDAIRIELPLSPLTPLIGV